MPLPKVAALPLLVAVLAAAPYVATAAEAGTIVLVGGVLRYDNQAVWQRIVELAGGPGAKIIVLPTASGRPRTYGGFAVRALRHHRASAELILLSPRAGEIDTDHRQVVQDPALLAKIRDADGIFFTGGAPQHIARALYQPDGRATPMLTSIRKNYAAGGVIAGANAARAVVSTGISAAAALQGKLPTQAIRQGLGLFPDGWFIDQHYFSHGRFAVSLVAMTKLSLRRGLGVGVNTAIVITGDGRAEVIGDGGAMMVDLSQAEIGGEHDAFSLRRAKLNYLGHGDKFDLDSLRITPHASKLDGFSVDPGGVDFQPWYAGPARYDDVLARPALTNMIFSAIDGEQKQGVGLARVGPSGGFKFRCYPGKGSFGWSSGRNNYTAINIYLDVTPLP